MPAAAVPAPASAQSTVTARPLASDSVTVKVSAGFSPASPSATFGLSMESVGMASSSSMVPMPSKVLAPPGNPPLTGAYSRTTTVSFASSSASPLTVISMVLLVSPSAVRNSKYLLSAACRPPGRPL